MAPNTEISKFYKLSLDKKWQFLKERAGLTDEDIRILTTGLELTAAERMIENVVGMIQVPIGIATNFRINNRDYLVPMAIEEASVVAAASHAAKLALPSGGFTATSSRPVMRGQIQVIDVKNLEEGRRKILDVKKLLITRANLFADLLPSLGGGVLDISSKVVGPPEDSMLIVEFFVDCKDAMGANTVITIAEGISPEIEDITGGKTLLKIISNLATERMAKATITYRADIIGGEKVVDGIVKAYKFACYDPYRAATHNKGIMNGITAITLSTANDTRAIEAGAHAYASISGKYLPLSKWRKDKNGDLVGELELPLALGTFGGATRTHPIAQLCLKILGVKTARELAEVACAVGLAQNFAALRAMVTEGIKRGHMELHARNIAIMAGATGDLVDKVTEILVKEGNVKVSRAKEILQSSK
jgi:hydroxymethylglutaryl-CoA reductase